MARSRDLIRLFKKVETLDDLENLNIGTIHMDISYRGGYLGFSGLDVAEFINVDSNLISNKVGAHSNYLGGGLRGSIIGSDYSSKIKPNKAVVLEELIDACKRVYKWIEDEGYLNDEEDPYGETNWDAIGTNKSRDAGITSAY